MRNIEAVPKPENPQFFDVPVGEIQDLLKLKLDWLKHSFGQTQRLTRLKDKRKEFYPAVHLGNGEYLNVLPDEKLGNYSFIHIDDPYEIDELSRGYKAVTAKTNIVFWFNMDDVFGKQKDRNIEQLKLQILKILTTQLFLSSGRLVVSNIFKKSEKIYQGFDTNEVESQFLMQPYGGFRFECSLRIEQSC